MVRAVETTGAEANGAVASMVEGQGDVHEAMIALQRADLTLQLSVQIRNKLVQAYQEIMRMPV
jgi:flagellar hook-basal body complex protein FliE